MNGVRRLAAPRPARVLTDAQDAPREINGRVVEAIREVWLLEDRWWTGTPLRRRYWEVVTEAGADLVIFNDLIHNGWWIQR
ncbi:MAG: hypothetical protein ACP5H2_10360 [Solirubrobacteraceae bacterium]